VLQNSTGEKMARSDYEKTIAELIRDALPLGFTLRGAKINNVYKATIYAQHPVQRAHEKEREEVPVCVIPIRGDGTIVCALREDVSPIHPPKALRLNLNEPNSLEELEKWVGDLYYNASLPWRKIAVPDGTSEKKFDKLVDQYKEEVEYKHRRRVPIAPIVYAFAFFGVISAISLLIMSAGWVAIPLIVLVLFVLQLV
jgi:hypothetical protein